MKKSTKKVVKKTKRTKTAPSGGNGFHDASLYYGDCLDLMTEWVADGRRAGTVDLIYLDPPFNSKVHYNILFGKESGGNGASAQVMAFDDTWIWDEAAKTRLDNLARAPYSHELQRTMDGLHAILGECGMLSYLTYMAERLHYCRRMLKPSGGIYLHCDPTASHYIKILMDTVFGWGEENFRNEIIWHYGGTGNQQYCFPSKHDVIFFYSVGGESRPLNRIEVKAKKTSGWTGKDTKLCDSVWDINTAFNSKDRPYLTGYPTQKPSELLERIIKASSNKGDLILDPFCGCGTTVVAAQRLGRRWCGIDISAFPVELIRARLHDIRGQIYVSGMPRDMEGARLLATKPFEFEKWAIMQIPGMLPNTKQVGEGGVDGRGRLENDIRGAVKPPAARTPLVIAQVTKSPGVNLNKIRALRSSMEEQKALFGVYITLERLTPTPAIRGILADVGRVKQGTSQYPRMQLYSIADYFEGKQPDLPPLATQRLLARGAAKARIQQDDFTF